MTIPDRNPLGTGQVAFDRGPDFPICSAGEYLSQEKSGPDLSTAGFKNQVGRASYWSKYVWADGSGLLVNLISRG